jgi:hypothetical protein
MSAVMSDASMVVVEEMRQRGQPPVRSTCGTFRRGECNREFRSAVKPLRFSCPHDPRYPFHAHPGIRFDAGANATVISVSHDAVGRTRYTASVCRLSRLCGGPGQLGSRTRSCEHGFQPSAFNSHLGTTRRLHKSCSLTASTWTVSFR